MGDVNPIHHGQFINERRSFGAAAFRWKALSRDDPGGIRSGFWGFSSHIYYML